MYTSRMRGVLVIFRVPQMHPNLGRLLIDIIINIHMQKSTATVGSTEMVLLQILSMCV